MGLPPPVTVANQGLSGFPTKMQQILMVTGILGRVVDPKNAPFRYNTTKAAAQLSCRGDPLSLQVCAYLDVPGS